jgi:hypothetical protein
VRRDVDATELLAAIEGASQSAWRVFRLHLPRSEALRCFGAALALHQRGLAPRPDGFLARGDDVAIAFAVSPGDDGLACRSIVVLLDRMLALGALDETRLRDGVVRTAAGALALLDPNALRTEGAIGAGRRAQARRLAASLQVDALR